MLLELSLGLANEAKAVRSAINAVLDKGYRTADIMSEGCEQVGCAKMSELVCEHLQG